MAELFELADLSFTVEHDPDRIFGNSGGVTPMTLSESELWGAITKVVAERDTALTEVARLRGELAESQKQTDDWIAEHNQERERVIRLRGELAERNEQLTLSAETMPIWIGRATTAEAELAAMGEQLPTSSMHTHDHQCTHECAEALVVHGFNERAVRRTDGVAVEPGKEAGGMTESEVGVPAPDIEAMTFDPTDPLVHGWTAKGGDGEQHAVPIRASTLVKALVAELKRLSAALAQVEAERDSEAVMRKGEAALTDLFAREVDLKPVDTGAEPSSVQERVHALTTRLPMTQIVTELIAEVGPTLVAFMADIRSRQMPHQWAAGTTVPNDAAQQRLMLAHQVFGIVKASDGSDIARAWLIGTNPRFKDESPAARIRAFDAMAVLGAAQNFAEDGGGT